MQLFNVATPEYNYKRLLQHRIKVDWGPTLAQNSNAHSLPLNYLGSLTIINRITDKAPTENPISAA